MDWTLYIQHLVSGYIPMIPILLAYFFILGRMGKKRTFAQIALAFVFCFYLFGILTMTGIWWLRPFSPKFVWVPFVDMVKGPVDTALNVLLFMPLGFFLPILYAKFDRLRPVVVAGFLISLSVEIVQMFGCGATDINELITNTAGTCLGYWIYRLIGRLVPKALRVEGAQGVFELCFFWAASLLIMATIQLSLFHALF